jgi:phosphate-selective porin OprO/OprP
LRPSRFPLFVAATLAGSAQIAHAETAAEQVAAPAPTPAPAPAKKPPSELEKIWAVPTLYKNDKSDGLNEIRIVGRFHLDNYVIDSDLGNANDLVVRRARLGLRAKLFHKLEANVQGDFNLEGGPAPFYTRLTDAYLAWKFSDAATLTVGKSSTEFTVDGATSGNRLITIDRSNINQNFGVAQEYLPGVTLGGKSGKWSYKAGVFSAGRNGGEFGDFTGGYAFVGSLGYDLGSAIGVKKAVLKGEYLYHKPNARANLLPNYEHVGALNLTLDDGNWGLTAEGVIADGALGQSDGHGLMVMPWINFSKQFQLVGRFTHMKSDANNGLRFSRYENVVTNRRGDRYNEAYAGLNYYIHSHNLKLQTGLSYANMRDRANDGGRYDGINWTTGFRVSW